MFYYFNISDKINIFLQMKEMDYDDDDDEEKMTNGDLSRDLRNDEDDLRDPVDVRFMLDLELILIIVFINRKD